MYAAEIVGLVKSQPVSDPTKPAVSDTFSAAATQGPDAATQPTGGVELSTVTL